MGDSRWWWLVALAAAGCGGRPRPAATLIANAPTGGDTYGGETYGGGDDGCEASGAEIGLWVASDLEAASLLVCTGEDTSPSEEAAAEGFVSTAMSARLVVTSEKDAVLVDDEIASWENGWEWGNTLTVLGMLDDGRGPSCLVVKNTGYDETGGRDTVQVWIVSGGAWTDVWDQSGTNVDTTIDGAKMTLVVNESEDQYDPDAATTTTTIEVRCTGGAISEISRQSDDEDDD